MTALRLPLVWVLMALTSAADAAEAEAQSSFTVSDAISWRRVVLPSGQLAIGPDPAVATFSPGGSRAAIQVRYGDVERDLIVDEIWIYESAVLQRYLEGSDGVQPPQGRLLLRQGAVARPLSALQWLGEKEIAFVMADPNGTPQVYGVDIETGVPRQLTNSRTAITSYDGNRDGILYLAPRASGEAQAHAVPVVDQTLFDLISPEPIEGPLLLHYRRRADGEDRRLPLPAMRVLQHYRRVWLSRDSRYAMLLAPATNAPEHWSQYEMPFYELQGFSPDKRSSDPESSDLLLRVRYMLVDLASDRAVPLLDAPAGVAAQNRTPPEVFWLSDRKSVVVTNTFLPLNADDPEEVLRRRRGPAIAEIDLESGAVLPIVFEPVVSDLAAGEKLDPIAKVYMEGDRMLVVEHAGIGRPARKVRFARRADRWEVADVGSQDRRKVTIAQFEALDVPPRLIVKGGPCNCERELLDLNPQVSREKLAKIRRVRWKDANGLSWEGGLLLPGGAEPGKKVPLVLQTHGFNTSEFLISGPNGQTTAAAAQPLAAAGIAVLQIEDNIRASSGDEREASNYAQGYAAAVAWLANEGIVDPGKVGLIAFSRTALHAFRLLADQPSLFKAAIISDGVWWGYVQDLLLLNTAPDVREQVRRLTGTAETGGFQLQSFPADPLYRLGHVTTAIRLEAAGVGSLLGYWEHYNVLVRAGRPVDFIYYPKGEHNLQRPSERVESQGGAVDWFRFWLQGYRDPDPAKAAQYRRWEKLVKAPR